MGECHSKVHKKAAFMQRVTCSPTLLQDSSRDSLLAWPYRAVQPQRDHHEEEEDGKERGSGHVGQGFRVSDEEEAGSWKRPL